VSKADVTGVLPLLAFGVDPHVMPQKGAADATLGAMSPSTARATKERSRTRERGRGRGGVVVMAASFGSTHRVLLFLCDEKTRLLSKLRALLGHFSPSTKTL
jgi:hypothetical protein